MLLDIIPSWRKCYFPWCIRQTYNKIHQRYLPFFHTMDLLEGAFLTSLSLLTIIHEATKILSSYGCILQGSGWNTIHVATKMPVGEGSGYFTLIWIPTFLFNISQRPTSFSARRRNEPYTTVHNHDVNQHPGHTNAIMSTMLTIPEINDNSQHARFQSSRFPWKAVYWISF